MGNMFEFNKDEALKADIETNGFSKGNVFLGFIEKVIIKDIGSAGAKKAIIEINVMKEMNNEKNGFVERTGVLEVSTITHKRGGEKSFGYAKVLSLIGIVEVQPVEQVVEDGVQLSGLEGKPIAVACYRADRWGTDKHTQQPKIYWSFEITHFFDPKTFKTYTEKTNDTKALKVTQPINDDLLDPNNPPAPSGNGGGFAVNPFGAPTTSASPATTFGGAPVQTGTPTDDEKNAAFMKMMEDDDAPF